VQRAVDQVKEREVVEIAKIKRQICK
jgi:hypothetical protein